MTRLYYYNPNVVTERAQHLPGVDRFSIFFRHIVNTSVMIADRTSSIRVPVRTDILTPIPSYRTYTLSFEEVCNARAKDLLARAEKRGVLVYVLWSGGIDSTLVLVSLLKQATPEQRKHIVVLLSEESIAEYPLFYARYIRGQLRRESSALFPQLLGTQHLFVTGQCADQILGGAVHHQQHLIRGHGIHILNKPYDRDVMFASFDARIQDEVVTRHYIDLFERVVVAAPIEIKTHFDYLWWLNFALKWNAAELCELSFATDRGAAAITQGYVQDNYAPFYATDDFQLWSMNNLDKRIKDTWESYKWVCKDIIYDFTGDAEYRREKRKRGSASAILVQQRAYAFIDSSFKFSRDLPVDTYYEPENDFR